MSINGRDHKVIYFLPVQEGITAEYWIEGIGSSRGPITCGYRPVADYEPVLICHKTPEFQYEGKIENEPCRLTNIKFCDIPTSMEPRMANRVDVQVYPNPVTHEVSFVFPNPSGAVFRIELRDQSGRLVFIKNHDKGVVNVSNLPAGLYVYSIFDKGNNLVGNGKIVK